jgi:hypothetical protein
VLDDAVEPLADRHVGSLPGVAGRFMRSRTTTSEIPRTARFHSRAQTAGATCARCRAGARQGQCERRGPQCLFGQLLRNRVNKRLKPLYRGGWRPHRRLVSDRPFIPTRGSRWHNLAKCCRAATAVIARRAYNS